MTSVIAAAATSICIIALITNSRRGLLVTIALKPMIDIGWANTVVFGQSFSAIVTVATVILVAFDLIFRKREHRNHTGDMFLPFKGLWILYFGYFVFVILFYLISTGDLLGEVGGFFRVSNSILGFFAFYRYFSNDRDFRNLVIAYIVGGFFPALVSIYQAHTGQIWHYRQTVGIVRYVGLYHDAVAVRIYLFSSILCIWIYFRYYLDRSYIIKKTFLIGFVILCFFALYKVYSKTVVVTMLVWGILFLFHKKYFVLASFGVVVLIVLNLLFSGILFEEYSHLFSKETAVLQGGRTDIALGGRLGLWEGIWREWKAAPFFMKVFGSRIDIPAHNEFLRILMSTGVVGLGIFLILIIRMGLGVFAGYLRHGNDMQFVGVLVFVQWLIEAMGQTPGVYSNFQWYVFGFIALALCGFMLQKEENEEKLA